MAGGRGGYRPGSGRKPVENPRNIRRLYRFSQEEADQIDKAVKEAQKEDKDMLESIFVRGAVLREAKRILDRKK